MAIPQGEGMNRLVVSKSISQPVHVRHGVVNLRSLAGLEVRKSVLEAGPPECGLIFPVEKEAPKTKVQLGDNLAGDLDLLIPGQCLPRFEDVGVGSLVQELRWVVIPLAGSALGGVPAGELLVEAVSQYHLEVALHVEEGARDGRVPLVEL